MKTSDITLVFQGAFKPYVTREREAFLRNIRLTRQVLPGAQVILSTWEGTDLPPRLGVDAVVLSPDPGPLAAASTPLLETLDGYLDHGAALEPAARSLFIHPNTLRYRLHRVAELTGADPWNARDVAVLRVALILGRLHRDGLHSRGGHLCCRKPREDRRADSPRPARISRRWRHPR